jgi:maltooligosyltrehalose synthase
MFTPEVAAHCKAALPHVRSVALFGIEAHVCVLQTALDLRDAGYDVHVVADGVSSTRQADRAIAFERMKQAGCFFTTSESLVFQLCETAQFPRFKEVSALMKEKRPESGLMARAAL